MWEPCLINHSNWKVFLINQCPTKNIHRPVLQFLSQGTNISNIIAIINKSSDILVLLLFSSSLSAWKLILLSMIVSEVLFKEDKNKSPPVKRHNQIVL